MNDATWLPLIDPTVCTGCGDCIAICPTQALAMVGGKAAIERPGACNYCAVCEALCPVGAIALPYVIAFETSSPAGSPSP
jgi:formate hydrogenlyase subunit 6/NADH:ubiquinone oxidoreductase subunit I